MADKTPATARTPDPAGAPVPRTGVCGLPGQHPLRRAEHLSEHDPPIARRVEQVRLRTIEDEVRVHPDLDQGLATERHLDGDPLLCRLGPCLIEHEIPERVPAGAALVDL